MHWLHLISKLSDLFLQIYNTLILNQTRHSQVWFSWLPVLEGCIQKYNPPKQYWQAGPIILYEWCYLWREIVEIFIPILNGMISTFIHQRTGKWSPSTSAEWFLILILVRDISLHQLSPVTRRYSFCNSFSTPDLAFTLKYQFWRAVEDVEEVQHQWNI